MGTQEEEAAALHRIQQEAVAREAAAIRAAEAARKAAEDAAKNQNNMVAVEPGRATGEAWPEASAEPNSPGLMSTVAGKLGVGKHGDLELAKKLLDAERRPATGETGRDTAAGGGAGTRADGATSRASRALGARGPAPAAER